MGVIAICQEFDLLYRQVISGNNSIHWLLIQSEQTTEGDLLQQDTTDPLSAYRSSLFDGPDMTEHSFPEITGSR